VEEGNGEGKRASPRTWSEMSDGHLRLSHPFSETSRSSNVVGSRNMKLSSEEERSEDCRRGKNEKRKSALERRDFTDPNRKFRDSLSL